MKRALLLLIVLFACAALAQTTVPGASATPSAAPSVTFTFYFPRSVPAQYEIAVDGLGRATYASHEADSSADTEPYRIEFTVSQPTRDRIFHIARDLNYFEGDFEYRRGNNIANLGAKTLTWRDADTSHTTRYNWSDNLELQELTEIFQFISNTLEGGRKLEYARRFDKLGVDAVLKELESSANNGRLAEIQAIAPTLRKVMADYSTMHVSRERAERLLKLADRPPTYKLPAAPNTDQNAESKSAPAPSNKQSK